MHENPLRMFRELSTRGIKWVRARLVGNNKNKDTAPRFAILVANVGATFSVETNGRTIRTKTCHASLHGAIVKFDYRARA